MKSIIQEASSIAKAVEQGWTKAGQPQEFSVKILELPERNFIGFTTRSAKVAVMFNERREEQSRDTSRRTQQTQRAKPHRETQQREERKQDLYDRKEQRTERPERTERIQRPERYERTERSEQREHQREPKEYRERVQHERTDRSQERNSEGHEHKQTYAPLWNDAFVMEAHDWLSKTLQYMKKDSITFTIEPQNYHLRITLSETIVPETDREKHVLASLSALLLETLKRKFRKQLRGHKIVITHQQ